jgi:RimJ/RimL family protein N-acetyltransferase
MTPPVLETDRLVLRGPCADDAAAFAAFSADAGLTRFVGGVMAPWESWRYLCEVIGHWTMRGFGRWIAVDKASGAPVGLYGLHYPSEWPEPEIGWLTFPGHQRVGHAREAAMAARRHAYDTLGWTTVISLIDPDNIASVAVAERLGAVRDHDFTHPRYGAMGVWRHPGPQEAAA